MFLFIVRYSQLLVSRGIFLGNQSCNFLDPPWPSGYDARLPSVSSKVRVSAGSPSGLAWSLYKCAVLWRTVCGPSATERPLGTIREE